MTTPETHPSNPPAAGPPRWLALASAAQRAHVALHDARRPHGPDDHNVATLDEALRRLLDELTPAAEVAALDDRGLPRLDADGRTFLCWLQKPTARPYGPVCDRVAGHDGRHSWELSDHQEGPTPDEPLAYAQSVLRDAVALPELVPLAAAAALVAAAEALERIALDGVDEARS